MGHLIVESGSILVAGTVTSLYIGGKCTFLQMKKLSFGEAMKLVEWKG